MYFRFCYKRENQIKLDKYIIHKSNKWYIKINTTTKIPIKINNDKILVDMDNVNDFIKFVIKKNVHCSGECSILDHYQHYLGFIIDNKMHKHIKLFIGKHIPFIESNDYHYWSQILTIIFKYIDTDIFQFIVDCCDYENMVFLLFNIFTVNPTFDKIECLLNRYRIVLTEYFANKNSSPDMLFLSIERLYKDCAIYNNVEIFKYVTAEIPDIFEDIDRDIINPKLIYYYDRYIIESKYNEGIRYLLLCEFTDLKIEYSEIYHCILTDGLSKPSRLGLITRVTLNDHAEYLRFLFEVSEKDDDFYRYINNLLKKCNNKPVEMFELFVEYGADYKPHMKKLIKSAKNVGNRKLVEHLKHIIEKKD